MDKNKPLIGYKVLELANILAGPSIGMFLSELGAEVIKVENKLTEGDITRQWKLPSEPPESSVSAYFCCANWGKSSFFLDLNDPNDYLQIQNWAKEVDIVISNFKLQAATRLKIDYDSLKLLNPRLIFAQLTAFGEEDQRLGFDVVLQAETGYMHMTGFPEGPPAKLPVALIDLLAAHQLKEGILCALLQRERTGEGAYVHTSLFEAGVSTLANQATNWLMAGHIPQRKGTQHPNIAPYGDVFRTKDHAAIVLAVGTDKQFQQLLEILEIPPDPRFSTNTLRVSHRDVLIESLQQRLSNWEAEDLLPYLHLNGVPAGKIRNMKEVFELPKAQSMILEEERAEGIQSRCVRTVAFELR